MAPAVAMLVSVLWLSETASARGTQAVEQEPVTVVFCDLAKDPASFDHKLIRLTSFLTKGFENFGLKMPICPAPMAGFALWATYGGTAQPGTIYCCPGDGNKSTRATPIEVEGIRIPLVEDKRFQAFRSLLRTERDTTVHVTLIGRFFAGEKVTTSASAYWGGYGHLGCCSLFVIQQVEEFDPHDRKDVDYTAEAGWYEKGGCTSDSMHYLRYVSLGDDEDGTVTKVISEQKQAEAGSRAWAFTDSERVANEALREVLKGQVLPLQKTSETPTRQVFRARSGKTAIVVVVIRPYWLSFYSRSRNVAWIVTTIKSANCR